MVEKPLRGTLNPFKVPTGPLGRLAGWVMGRDDTAHREIVGLLNPGPGACSCEVGCGPGQLLVLLAARDPQARVWGVDPSPVMLGQARRRLDRAGVAERVDLRLGEAGAVPLPDGQADHVVSVNAAALWPDLAAGLREAGRVLHPGGSLLIAWHSATSPVAVQRRLARPRTWWDDTAGLMRRMFGAVERHDLTHTTACTAVKLA
jgi:ubiquinone/menaquinone biosynthesis C-methylase UbiE